MTRDALNERNEVLHELAREAGALALAHFRDLRSLTVVEKGVQDMASNADVAVEALIRRRLAAACPGDGFLGEESGGGPANPGRGLWVVDPIDGTACFVKGIPSWTVSIAYLCDGEIELGVIFDPVHDELFAARRGGGARLNGETIRCGGDTDFSQAMTGLGISTRVEPEPTARIMARLLAAGGMFHRCGSGALSLAYVACGRLNAYYEAHINSWDCLAGLLLVREAGGWTNDFLAGDGLIRGNEIMASAPGLKDQLPALIRDAGQS